MRIGLVGCAKTKRPYAAPARDLYVSPLFAGRRRWVESTCDSWFVLSAKHGLLHPDTIIEPYDESLTNVTATARRAWAERVADTLLDLVDHRDVTYEAHAGAAYLAHGLADRLTTAGHAVETPAAGLGIGQQLAMYRHTATAA